MTKEACQSRDCCYNEKNNPGAQEEPQCYYPANAEIDAYFQTAMIAQGIVPCILCRSLAVSHRSHAVAMGKRSIIPSRACTIRCTNDCCH